MGGTREVDRSRIFFLNYVSIIDLIILLLRSYSCECLKFLKVWRQQRIPHLAYLEIRCNFTYFVNLHYNSSPPRKIPEYDTGHVQSALNGWAYFMLNSITTYLRPYITYNIRTADNRKRPKTIIISNVRRISPAVASFLVASRFVWRTQRWQISGIIHSWRRST